MEDVLFATIRLDVVNILEQRSFHVILVWFPGPDVGGVELEDAEAEVARKHRLFVFDSLRGTTEAFLGKFGNAPSLSNLVTEFGGRPLVLVSSIK